MLEEGHGEKIVYISKRYPKPHIQELRDGNYSVLSESEQYHSLGYWTRLMDNVVFLQGLKPTISSYLAEIKDRKVL